VAIDGERSLLDGGLEVAARLRCVLDVEGGERAQRGQQIRAVGPRLQHLLQLPGHPWSQRRRHLVRRQAQLRLLAVSVPARCLLCISPPPFSACAKGGWSFGICEVVAASRTRDVVCGSTQHIKAHEKPNKKKLAHGFL
jgi:hypothetical protein